MLVAQLTHDHLEKKKGNVPFTIDGLSRVWSGEDTVFAMPVDRAGEKSIREELNKLPQTLFRLYDDDGELYYSGWLKDDDRAMVQQFVLAWAMADSGCTMIKVKVGNEWKQVID